MATLQREIRDYYAHFKYAATATGAAALAGLEACSPEYNRSLPAAAGLVATIAFLYSVSQMIFAARAEGEKEQLNQQLRHLKSKGLDNIINPQ